MKSLMSHQFSMVPSTGIQRSAFLRNCGHKTSFDEGYLIPFFCDEVLPGDTFKLKVSHLTRLATPIVPFMDNVFTDMFFFFVPSRLVWDNWQRFNGERDNPDDSTDYLIPQLTSPENGFSNGSIFDYFGLPTKVANFKFNSLPLRAYNLIYNEWFRDQNLIDSVPVEKGDIDSLDNYKLLKRAKQHDYFTSCLPWPQKGEAVTVPITTDIIAKTLGSNIDLTSSKVNIYSSSGTGTYNVALSTTTPVTASLLGVSGYVGDVVLNHSDHKHQIDQDALNAIAANIAVNSSGDNVVNVNDLRTAFQVQRMLEKDARGGTRYAEILRSHFDVISPDSRLQRPEFLGGSSTRLNVNPVEQTASTDTTSPQGNLAAFGYSSDSRYIFNKSFVEHGYIIGLLNVRADLTYQQGLERFVTSLTKASF